MGTRIVSILLAGLFFVSTVGFSVYVIIEANRDTTPASNTQTAQVTDPDNTNEIQGENVLKGTTLEGFTPISTPVAELEKIDLVEGTGKTVAEGANVTVHYTGALVSDGTIFESSLDSGQPITFGLEGLIQGWQEGIPGMKVGGKRRLVIPAAKAYGASATGSIPANSDLVFDIELIGITE